LGKVVRDIDPEALAVLVEYDFPRVLLFHVGGAATVAPRMGGSNSRVVGLPSLGSPAPLVTRSLMARLDAGMAAQAYI